MFKSIKWKFVLDKTVFYCLNIGLTTFLPLSALMLGHWVDFSQPGAILGFLLGYMLIGVTIAPMVTEKDPPREVKLRPARDPNRPRYRATPLDFAFLLGVPTISCLVGLLIAAMSPFANDQIRISFAALAVLGGLWITMVGFSIRVALWRRCLNLSASAPQT